MQANFIRQIAQNNPSDFQLKPSAFTLYKRFYGYIWQHKLPLLAGSSTIFFLSLLQVIIPQITRYIIDVIIPEKKFNLIPWVGLSIAIIALLIGVLNFARSYMMSLVERIFEILDTQPEVKEKSDAIALPPIEGNIRWEGVEFAYTSSQPVIHNFTLNMQPGMTVALVGSSGAGKSTLANLAARFYDPQKGQILVDGHDIRDVTLQSLRSQMGIVSQETLLLHKTVRENIAYGKPGVNHAEIETAAKVAHAHEFIISLPQSYDTVIGERGMKLSGGQRQRLAIARALMKNPPILILDEATSALDTESEHLIQQALQQLLKNRTCLVIAHRLSTIQNADLIVVLENGYIIETGTHSELLTKGGRYAYLHTMQFPQKLQLLSGTPA